MWVWSQTDLRHWRARGRCLRAPSVFPHKLGARLSGGRKDRGWAGRQEWGKVDRVWQGWGVASDNTGELDHTVLSVRGPG